ncbi:MAG: hypothetical protein HY340_03810 [Candidatus Kerfeldbacteria bacterium]|nr:hypothetical protein [Candidatus Kerfeldbacteria bacterium]
MNHARSNSHSGSVLVLTSVFAVACAFFLFLQSEPVFPDPDSFYHIKVAEQISRYGVVDEFPWLTYTTLATSYTDQHFLYHVVLIPFVELLDPVAGAKLATVLINAGLITLIAAFLIRFRVRPWWLYTLILLVTNPFLFRISLVKAPGLSLIFLVVGLWLLMAGRRWPLAILAFLYVWTYGGFALLAVLGVAYAVIASLVETHRRGIVISVFRRLSPRRGRLKELVRQRPVQQALVILLGLTVGILINPYFPNNLYFYWQQLIQIGIVNFQDVVNVGGEWHPYGFVELIANTVFVSIAVLLALITFVTTHRRQSAESWTLLPLAIFFFLITLKSRRYVELYVPFAVLFSAFALRDGVRQSSRELQKKALGLFARRRSLAVALLFYVAGASFTVILRDERQLARDLQSGFRATELAGVSDWLRENTPKGSIVVHSDWDEFPILFYHNTHNRYIVGLDPTFMYQYDRVLHERWADLTRGVRGDDATQVITQDLKSTLVLVTKDHEPFDRIMQRQTGFTVVYEDDEAKVYQLQPGQAVPAAPERTTIEAE